jgi:phospholipid-binding lipoprotein MlaA
LRGYRILTMFALILCIEQLHAEVKEDQNSPETVGEIDDPFEDFNRVVYQFNWALDTVLFHPASEIYGLVPSPVRTGVRNFIYNLNSPVIFINDLLQLEGTRAGQTLVRTLINTTLGIGGLFDVATDMGLEYHREDFGQTLAVGGVPSGPYLVLPIFGPSSPRDLVGLGVTVYINPVNWVFWNNDLDWAVYTRDGMYMLDTRTQARGFTDELEKAIDPYVTVRSLYAQTRGDHVASDEDSPKPTDSE